MKKQLRSLLCVLTAAIMLLSVSSCGKSKDAPAEGKTGRGKIVMEDSDDNKVIFHQVFTSAGSVKHTVIHI